jgi:hypothetical protein
VGQRPALCEADLDGQTIELLPQRETLYGINVVNVVAVNLALAINAATYGSAASAFAQQQLFL